MNSFNGIGRLTSDPEVRYTNDNVAIARYTLAIDRQKEGTDFLNCTALAKSGEFAEKYLHKGMKIGISGRVQTSSYTNKEGKKVYTTEIIVSNHFFCESKKSEGSANAPAEIEEGFINIPEGVDEDLPFAQPTR